MKIALISDIHSNQFAFQAVLDDLKQHDIDHILFIGDYAFGGAGSIECVDMLRTYNSHHYTAIKGNKEEYIYGIESNNTQLHTVLYHIYDELGTDRVNFLKSLPESIDIFIGGLDVKLCHNPSILKLFKVGDRLKRDDIKPNFDSLTVLSNEIKSDICVFGHYHAYMDEVVNNKRFICAGSVGLPFGNDYRATYVILDTVIEKSELIHVDYDRTLVIDDFHRKGYFKKFDDWSMNTVISMMTGCNYIGTQDLRK